jgi:hypothetical protein
MADQQFPGRSLGRDHETLRLEAAKRDGLGQATRRTTPTVLVQPAGRRQPAEGQQDTDDRGLAQIRRAQGPVDPRVEARTTVARRSTAS